MDREPHLGNLPLWGDDEAKKVLTDLCKQYEVPLDVLEDLVKLQREMLVKSRAAGSYEAIAEIIGRLD